MQENIVWIYSKKQEESRNYPTWGWEIQQRETINLMYERILDLWNMNSDTDHEPECFFILQFKLNPLHNKNNQYQKSDLMTWPSIFTCRSVCTFSSFYQSLEKER